MNNSRTRCHPKQQIFHEIVFNHRDQPTQSSSEASFLKLSEKNSQQLQGVTQWNCFVEIQNILKLMQTKQIIKIKKIATDIKRTIDQQSQVLSLTKKEAKENKENNVTVFRILQLPKCQKSFIQEGNFQMDQNLNYVKGTLEMSLSSENYNKKQQISQKQQACFKIAESSQYSVINTPKNDKDRCKSSHSTSRTKRKTTITTCKDETKRRGRIYEEILSLYSTARLLALQKKYL